MGRPAAQADFPTPVDLLARVRIPKHFDRRSPQARRDLAASQRQRPGGTAPAGKAAARRRRRRRDRPAEPQLRQHPCHGCADREEHARWAER